MAMDNNFSGVKKAKRRESVSRDMTGNTLARYSLTPKAEAAMGAENPTIKDTHPLRNPRSGWYSLDRKIYSPPASGMAAPNSPYDKAPQRAIRPPAIHNEIIHTGEFNPDISNPEVVKIPAPTILAITILVMEKRPSDLFSEC
jgi:hypothetical protein